MSVGKYSPTVTQAYMVDRDWWAKNGGGDDSNGKDINYDKDGYDRYGYDQNDVDRAGNTEDEYLSTVDEETYSHYLYEQVGRDWTAAIIDGVLKPVER